MTIFNQSLLRMLFSYGPGGDLDSGTFLRVQANPQRDPRKPRVRIAGKNRRQGPRILAE